MNAKARQATFGFIALCAFAVVSWLVFRGYLTPDMLIYFLSFKWCF